MMSAVGLSCLRFIVHCTGGGGGGGGGGGKLYPKNDKVYDYDTDVGCLYLP